MTLPPETSAKAGAPDSGGVARTPHAIAAAARARGIVIPEACRSGVESNLALLESHVRRMRGEDGADNAGGGRK